MLMKKIAQLLTAAAFLSLPTDVNKNEQHPLNVKETILKALQGKDTVWDTSWKQGDYRLDVQHHLEIKDSDSPYKDMIANIKEPIILWNLLNSEVAITIDDGAGSDNITTILDTLDNHNIKATFFIVWERISLHANEWKKALKSGHQICNHSYSHHYFRQTNPEKLEQEILKRENAVKTHLGEDYLSIMKRDYPFFRFPWGCWANESDHLAVLRKHGYLPLWRSSDRWNWENIRNGEILLFHFKKSDFKRIWACAKKVEQQGKSCKQLTDIIDPNSWYTPIWRKNLDQEKKKANQILDKNS